MHFRIDGNDLSWMFSIVVAYLIIGWFNRRKARKALPVAFDQGAMPQIMFHGNENYSLTNL